MNTSNSQSIVAGLIRGQAKFCTALGSPLYAQLLRRAAEDAEAGGPTWEVVRGYDADPPDSMLALRLMGAVHRLVLEGRARRLARHYPSVGGAVSSADQAWHDFVATIDEHSELLREMILHPVQTNEVGRAAAIVGGFLSMSEATGLPLRILEIGASAGLNLRWDHFRYEASPRNAWGPRRSPVRFAGMFEGTPPFHTTCEVLERRGCDPQPIDPASREGELTLKSYIWPDQLGRLKLLRGAIRVARRVPAVVDQAGATDWLVEELARLHRRSVTVVFHTIVWQYLLPRDRRHVESTIEHAGKNARRDTVLAWLRMEPAGKMADVTLTVWPGAQERRIARCGYHGRPVQWIG
jgi:hypothetical protein